MFNNLMTGTNRVLGDKPYFYIGTPPESYQETYPYPIMDRFYSPILKRYTIGYLGYQIRCKGLKSLIIPYQMPIDTIWGLKYNLVIQCDDKFHYETLESQNDEEVTFEFDLISNGYDPKVGHTFIVWVEISSTNYEFREAFINSGCQEIISSNFYLGKLNSPRGIHSISLKELNPEFDDYFELETRPHYLLDIVQINHGLEWEPYNGGYVYVSSDKEVIPDFQRNYPILKGEVEVRDTNGDLEFTDYFELSLENTTSNQHIITHSSDSKTANMTSSWLNVDGDWWTLRLLPDDQAYSGKRHTFYEF